MFLLDLQAVPKQNNAGRQKNMTKGTTIMKKRLISALSALILTVAILAVPVTGRAQSADQEDNGIFVLGSILFSILHVPLKLATCVGTQATAAVAYTATFGVPGNYDGGTNGKDIGETARRSCTGSWFITPSQVKSDYGS
jgi:hypothetical protein